MLGQGLASGAAGVGVELHALPLTAPPPPSGFWLVSYY